MCGIAGLLVCPRRSVPGTRQIQSVLDEMVGALTHRGPDDRGSHIVSPVPGRPEITDTGMPVVGFVHTRLAILDLSSAGHQPMEDPATGNWITYNGEIYNFGALREQFVLTPQLSAFSRTGWASQTDTEVILKAYARWGRESVVHLRGMFAFGLWDAQRQELFLARDRLGVKPLYYYSGDGFFLFASEVRALLASGPVPRRLDPLALWHYLAYQAVPAPRTFIEGVHMLPPGCWLAVDAQGSITEKHYWDLLENAWPGGRTVQRPRVG